MRKQYDSQLQLDSIPIEAVAIDLRSRDELPQLLLGLQYIFKDASLRDSILAILKADVLSGKNRTGRPGMSMWELFVFGSCRLNLNIDYDRLHDLSNNHKALRGILGVLTKEYLPNAKHYSLQTIKDNVGLISEEKLVEINELIVKAGHGLKKNPERI